MDETLAAARAVEPDEAPRVNHPDDPPVEHLVEFRIAILLLLLPLFVPKTPGTGAGVLGGGRVGGDGVDDGVEGAGEVVRYLAAVGLELGVQIGDGGGGAAEVDDELGEIALSVPEVGLQLRADLGDERKLSEPPDPFAGHGRRSLGVIGFRVVAQVEQIVEVGVNPCFSLPENPRAKCLAGEVGL